MKSKIWQHKATIKAYPLMTYVVPNLSHSSNHLCNLLIFLYVSSKHSNVLLLWKCSLIPPEIICLTSTRWWVMPTSLTGTRERNWIKFITLKLKYKSGQPSLAMVWHYLYIPVYMVYNFGKQIILNLFPLWSWSQTLYYGKRKNQILKRRKWIEEKIEERIEEKWMT